MKIRALDYILDNDDNFWIVKKVDHNHAYGQMVYEVSETGRYNPITNKYYQKVIINNCEEHKAITSIKKIFYPDTFYQQHKDSLTDKWNELTVLLVELGINEKDIGIYGSYLIGFKLEHDIDYVVYGKRSYQIIKQNIGYIKDKLRLTSITDDHIKYQCAKYKHLYNDANELGKVLKHNWVGLQFGVDALSTIRFNKRGKHYIDMSGTEMTIEGVVIEGEGTNFIPRVGTVKTNNGNIRVITYFWMFNAFLRKGEKVLIRGIYNEERKELYLTNNNHWIRYLSPINNNL